MRSQKGVTLIECLIAIVMCTIVFLIVFNVVKGQGNTVSWGINGAVEQRCINGLAFTVSSDGSTRQVYDQFGHGVPCG